MFYGKLVAGFLGLILGGPIGLLIGLFLGHAFDQGLARTAAFVSPQNLARIQRSFFDTTFMLLGHMAKADGRISQQEIDHAEGIFNQLGLNAEQRKRAIDLFQRGAKPEFQAEPVIAEFVEVCGAAVQLRQTLLMSLVSMVLADQTISAPEREALQRVASLLGTSPAQLDQLLRMAQAQGSFHSSGHSGQSARPEASLKDAYAALGVSADVDDKTLKRAYRKLMSENHPDKLIAKGVPDDMVKLATQRSQEIQAAYEMIKKSRG